MVEADDWRAARLIHQESSAPTKRILKDAIKRKLSIIWRHDDVGTGEDEETDDADGEADDKPVGAKANSSLRRATVLLNIYVDIGISRPEAYI